MCWVLSLKIKSFSTPVLELKSPNKITFPCSEYFIISCSSLLKISKSNLCVQVEFFGGRYATQMKGYFFSLKKDLSNFIHNISVLLLCSIVTPFLISCLVMPQTPMY